MPSGIVGCACCTMLIRSTLSDVLSLKFRVFSFLQTLPRVPRLYSPSGSCPSCSRPNDEDFKFCQQCGYVRRSDRQPSEGLTLKIYEKRISQRLQVLSYQWSSSRYARQSALERELIQFLESLSIPKSLASALPTDVIAFLVWKDRGGKTKVHNQTTTRDGVPCDCPKRLAFGTVDTLIGKLRSIFADNGRGVEWHSRLGVGNPASCRFDKRYLADVREEQLRARFTPKQAERILVRDLAVISEYIQYRLKVCWGLRAIQIFVLAIIIRA